MVPTPHLSSPGLGFCLSSPSFSSLYDHSHFDYLLSWLLGFWLVLTLLDTFGCCLPHIYNKPSPQPHLGAIMPSFFILRPYVLEPQPTGGGVVKIFPSFPCNLTLTQSQELPPHRGSHWWVKILFFLQGLLLQQISALSDLCPHCSGCRISSV